MKALVTYFSHSGNTEKVARAIYEVINTDKDITDIKEVKSVEKYDVIFCGFPVRSHGIPAVAEGFIKSLPPGKKLAIFTTHGSLRGGQLAVTAIEQAVSLAMNTKVIGTFGCRGKVEQRIIDDLMSQPEHRAWAQEAQSADSHPDSSDLEDAKDFAIKMMAKTVSI